MATKIFLPRFEQYETQLNRQTKQQNEFYGFNSESELYRLMTAAGRRILVPTFADRGVSRGQRGGSPTAVNLSFLDRNRYCFLSSSSSFMLTRLSGPRSRPTDTQENWQRRESNPGPPSLQPGSLTTRPQRRSHLNRRRTKRANVLFHVRFKQR
jgi:hypothetical protein